jgi:hypothetical protein
MAESRRGAALTILAALFIILAVTDILKPFHLEGPTTGLVFFGTRLSGVANAVLGPALGIFLIAFGVGIWRMRRYALTVAIVYAIYVSLNLVLYAARNPPPADRTQQLAGIIYTIVALAFTWGTALVLSRRRADLG